MPASPMTIPFATDRQFIGGDWRAVPGGATLALEDPSDGSELARIGRGSAADIDDAVAAARAALDGRDASAWGRLSATERGRILSAIGRKVLENVELLAALEVHDVGKPLKQARADAIALARYCEFYGGAADKVHGATLPIASGFTALTLREPHGVTGHIVPWNYPMQIVGRSVGAALAMGNACVLKPAEEACLTVLAFARICAEAGLPAGALNVVTGLGEEAGAALAGHGGIDHVSFTGSVATGALVQIAAARNAVPVTLELGGKSPQIVFADADLDAALPFLVNAGIQNAGQTCSAASRILVERPVFEQVRARMAERYRALRVGAGRGRPRSRPGDLAPPEGDRRPLPRRGARRRTDCRRRRQRRRRCASGRVLRAADAGRRRPARSLAGAGRDLRPGAGADRVRRRGRGDPHRQRHRSTASSPASGRRTARARCGWRARCAAARCSSTTTAPAAASSCRSAASSTRATAARRASRRSTASRR